MDAAPSGRRPRGPWGPALPSYLVLGAAVLLLAALPAWAAGAAPPNGGDGTKSNSPPRKKFKVSLEDIVIAFPADTQHLEVAKASRVWRKGVMRTFIANSGPPPEDIIQEAASHNETWSWYPDDAPKRSLYAGDSRAGLVPFLAHAEFGDTYKWLLYMDDDTIFFPDALLRMLEDFDPDMPTFISDHLWYSNIPGKISSHPNKAAPRCLPCGFDAAPYEGRPMPFPAPRGCPCTPELLCAAKPAAFNRFCDMPRHPENTYSMHGGAGGVMSIGLMRSVSLQFMETCTQSLYSTGGDAFISICLWQAGYALTDPGPSLFHPDLQFFDPGPEDRLGAMTKLASYIVSKKDIHGVPSNTCNATCELQLQHMVSLHVRSRMFATLDDAASYIRGVSVLYEVYAEIRARAEERTAAEAAAKEAAAAAAAAAAGEVAADDGVGGKAAGKEASVEAKVAQLRAEEGAELTQAEEEAAEAAEAEAAAAAAAAAKARGKGSKLAEKERQPKAGGKAAAAKEAGDERQGKEGAAAGSAKVAATLTGAVWDGDDADAWQ